MVIDPLTAIAKAGALGAARTVANRFIYMVKDEDISLMVTALSETDDPRDGIHGPADLDDRRYVDPSVLPGRSGERNRALTIVKSRGTSHSNQVRELVLSDAGPTLTDVYTAGGEVLMGTLRWEKEAEESAKKDPATRGVRAEAARAAVAEAKTSAQIKALQLDLERQRAALALNTGEDNIHTVASNQREIELRERRGADPARVSAVKRANGEAK